MESFEAPAAPVSATAGSGTAASGASASDLDLLDAMAQAELVCTLKASALALLDACAARVERVNPQLNAAVSQFLERACAPWAAKRPALHAALGRLRRSGGAVV